MDNAFVILLKKFVLKAIFLQYWSCLELLRPKKFCLLSIILQILPSSYILNKQGGRYHNLYKGFLL